MKLIPTPLDVGITDGFVHDIFSRKVFGEALINLLNRSNDSLVISIDGPWGEGKTTFVKMWQGLLKERGLPSIYIDAFENDYLDDAFISIAGSITAFVEQNYEANFDRKKFRKAASKVGLQLLSWSAKVAVKAATLGAIKEADLESLSDIKDDLASGASDAITKFVESRIANQKQEKEIVVSFRSLLSELPSHLKDNDSNKLVIIIDELDRCRPSFAVEVLEKIKHLFSVPNIVFVLVMNKYQLEEAVRCVYGANIDAHTYLQKFINIETHLPKRSERGSDDIEIYARRLLGQHQIEIGSDKDLLLENVAALGRRLNLSFRQIEKVFVNLTIIYATLPRGNLRLAPIIAAISVLKVVNPQVFRKICSDQASYADVSTSLLLKDFPDDDRDSLRLSRIGDYFRFCLLNDEDFSELDQQDPVLGLSSVTWNFNVERHQILPHHCAPLQMIRFNEGSL